MKRILLGIGAVLLLAFVGAGLWAWSHVSDFDESMAKVYDVPVPDVQRSTDPAVLARGKHLAESLGACTDCHGPDLANGKAEDLGPLGRLKSPNLTTGKNGSGSKYTDGQMVRAILHGLNPDGRGLRFMPSHEFSWWPLDDAVAIVSYIRTLPPVDTEPNYVELTVMAKVLDRHDAIPLDAARRIDHSKKEAVPEPAPTKEYGAFVARGCQGCHGTGFSGGRIPGTPPSIPEVANLTPHETGLAGWTYDDFVKAIGKGVSKDGRKLNPFMPTTNLKKLNETEKRALWAYLQSVPAKERGGR